MSYPLALILSPTSDFLAQLSGRERDSLRDTEELMQPCISPSHAPRCSIPCISPTATPRRMLFRFESTNPRS